MASGSAGRHGWSWERCRHCALEICEVKDACREISAAHAVWSVVQSEHDSNWWAQLNWDDGRKDRVLRFETKEEAENWIRGGLILDI